MIRNIGGGVVTLKPVGGIVSPSTTLSQSQIEAQKRLEEEKQRRMNDLMSELHKNNEKNQQK